MFSRKKDKEEQDMATPNATEATSAKTEPDPIKPQKVKTEQAGAAKIEPAKTEPVKVKPPNAEPPKTEPANKRKTKQAGAARIEPTKTEPVKVKPPNAEPPKTEPANMVPPETTASEFEPAASPAMEAPAAEESEAISMAKDVPPKELDRIVRHHVWGAMGIGLIPFPLLDFIGITVVQINLLRKLALAYGIPFFEDRATKVIGSLAASALPVITAPPLAYSLIKAIPLLGQTIGVVTMPVFSGAATYALGKVFIQHFASGGTFLTFDPNKVKAYYTEMLKEGQQVAAKLK